MILFVLGGHNLLLLGLLALCSEVTLDSALGTIGSARDQSWVGLVRGLFLTHCAGSPAWTHYSRRGNLS